MTSSVNLSRRRFITASAAAGSGLALAITLPGCDRSASGKALIRNMAQQQQPTADPGFLPNVFLRITADDIITVQLPSSEMGQGVVTALPMLIAEELAVTLERIQMQFAPAHKAFANPNLRNQLTGGSQSIRGFWQPLRLAGATARKMLIEAAALTWQVPPGECHADEGKVWHNASDRSLSYGALAAAASRLDVPKDVALKPPQQFTLIGTAQPRLDIPLKVNGQAVFGIDVRLDNLLIACVAKSPVFGAKLISFDANAARNIAGVRDVIAIDSGIAVVAENFWAAKKGREALRIEWDNGENSTLNSQTIKDAFVARLKKAKTVRSEGNPETALDSATRRIEAEYEVPYLAHACMEPMNCTAYVQADRCDVWVPTQAQSTTQKTAADITGLPKDQVFVHTTYLGGGFGRRGETDFVRDAVQIAHAIKQPVKLIWTREQDIQHDYYRPAAFNRLQAAVDDEGWPLAWRHQAVSPSILSRLIPLPGILLRGVDPTATEGAARLPYAFPHFEMRYAMASSKVPVGFWRSVGNSQNGYIVEAFLDEVAALGGKDPLLVRQHLLKDQPRCLQVLQLAAEKARWKEAPPPGHYRGIAMVHSFGSFVAQVAEISLQGQPGSQSVRVHKVVCAVDCGIVVNPDTVKAQVESAVVYGLTAALYGDITIQDGAVQQSNFHDYPLLRLAETPHVEIHMVDNADEPGGVGEIGVPPIAPAVVNAVFAATGKPIRRLPIRL